MPVLRYITWVGASLLTLLFIADSYLPKAAERVENPRTYKIAIQTRHQGPEAVSFSGDNVMFTNPVAAEVQSQPTSERVRDAFAKLDETAPQTVAPQRKKSVKRKVRKPASDYAQNQQYRYSRNQNLAYSRTSDLPFQHNVFW